MPPNVPSHSISYLWQIALLPQAEEQKRICEQAGAVRSCGGVCWSPSQWDSFLGTDTADGLLHAASIFLATVLKSRSVGQQAALQTDPGQAGIQALPTACTLPFTIDLHSNDI